MQATELIQSLDEAIVRKVFAESHCETAVMRNLKLDRSWQFNKRVVDGLIEKFSIDTSHFDRMKKNRKYVAVTKTCPVCQLPFKTLAGSPREKQVCSVACSNTHFRSGLKNGNTQKREHRLARGDVKYHEVCWQHHERRCVICGEDLVVDAHHYNDNHADNRPENFVPLCPTHHKYWHSRHRHLIKDRVDAYVKNYEERSKSSF